ncbi:P-loop NTPase [Mycoplasmatota bacterium]|nr:P-loop NTPase [Mycoplasmatota bacterium]
MITEKQITEKLSGLIDPTSGKTLKSNGGIRKITIDKENNKVYLIIALADDTSPKKDDFQYELMKILKLELGFSGVRVEYTKLNTRAAGETTILAPNSKVNFLAVASGKGGVGKSTLTANIGVALSRMGKKVGIIDADIYGSSINQVMEITKLPTQRENLIIPVLKEGIEVITTAMLVDGNKPIMWRGPMLQKLLKHFLNDVKWSADIEYILIDLPPGTGDVAMDIQQLIPQTRQLLVTTPHPSASHVAVRAGLMAKELRHPIIGVIENMSYLEIDGNKHNVFGNGGGQQVSKELGIELLEQIPLTQPTNGKYHSLFLETDELSKTYDRIAEQIIDSFNKK